MAKKLFLPLLKRFLVPHKKGRKAGFTLTELLVSILIAGIVITALLSFVVDLVDTDRREYSRSETQRDMQTALDFMVADLREAVYVYDNLTQNRSAANSLTSYLPNFENNAVPILAFWKAERLPYSSNESLPTSCSTGDQECNQILIKRRAYTLVVYLQEKNPVDDPKWKGKSRIMRYALRKYNNLPTLSSKTPGYVDPQESGFENWPVGGTNNGSAALPTGGPPVLVDFVDDPSDAAPISNLSSLQTCTTSTDQNDPLYTESGQPQNYKRLPANYQTSASFFVCVKTLATVTGTNQQEAANQDVIIYLRGNPSGKVNANRKDPLETLRTQAIARGVIDKKPQ